MAQRIKNWITIATIKWLANVCTEQIVVNSCSTAEYIGI
jgi:hypothetical protein